MRWRQAKKILNNSAMHLDPVKRWSILTPNSQIKSPKLFQLYKYFRWEFGDNWREELEPKEKE